MIKIIKLIISILFIVPTISLANEQYEKISINYEFLKKDRFLISINIPKDTIQISFCYDNECVSKSNLKGTTAAEYVRTKKANAKIEITLLKKDQKKISFSIDDEV